MGLNMFANPIITPVIILYNIKSLEFICFNTFENANIDKTIPKLTATTGQQMVHHIQLIGFKSQKQGKIIYIFLLLNEKYKNKAVNKSKIIFSNTTDLYDIEAILKKLPSKTI